MIPTIRKNENTVECVLYANGRNWTFSHERSTAADADNLHTLLLSEFENIKQSEENRRHDGEGYTNFLRRRCARTNWRS